MSDVTLDNTIATGQQRSPSKLMENFEKLRDHINSSGWIDSSKYEAGSVDTSVLADDAVTPAKLSEARGKAVIATEESRTNTAYGTLTTPDRVSSVVVPSDGLLCIAYQAVWKESVAKAARAALFIGANQLKVQANGGGTVEPSTTAATLGAGSGIAAPSTNLYKPLVSDPSLGLVSDMATSATANDVATGQLIGFVSTQDPIGIELGGTVTNVTPGATNYMPTTRGGACLVFVAAGTYDVSVQFKASSGSVTVKNRRLYVWTIGF